VQSADNQLYAVNPDGTKKWSTPNRSFEFGNMPSSPAVDAEGAVYIGSQDGALRAFNADGTAMWSAPIPMLESSPSIGADGTIYIASDNHSIYAVGP
jgi:outer membrane protein assembly factor BamB